jgi:hypothetical protein
VAVDVDEPGRHHQPRRVDDAKRRRVAEVTAVRDGDDAVAGDRHVGRPTGCIEAVDEESARDDEVVHGGA